MADKLNCSTETPINKPSDIRRNKISTLSNVFKTQSSSVQHRANPKCRPSPSGGGAKMFLLKVLIAGGAVYTTSFMGIWGDSEETHRLYTKTKNIILNIENEKLISDETKAELIEKVTTSAEFVKVHLARIPDDIKSYYEVSEKFITDFINSKK